MIKIISSTTISVALLAALALSGQAQAQATDVDCNKCVDTADIAAGAVTGGKLANQAVTRRKLAGGAVSTGKLAFQAVTTEKLAADSVTTGKIADGAVTAAKLDPGALAAAATRASMGFDTATFGRNTITDVEINGGQIVAPVAAGSSVQIDASYALNNSSGCPSCIVQLRVGFEGVPGVDCIYNGIPAPQPNPPTTGSGSVTLTAPITPGVYTLVADATLQFSCITGSTINAGSLGQLIGVIAVE